MRVVKAKVLDLTHLELGQPVSLKSGEYVSISITEDEEENLWQDASKKHFFDSYSEADSIYDQV